MAMRRSRHLAPGNSGEWMRGALKQVGHLVPTATIAALG
jgi:hypothetical protein